MAGKKTGGRVAGTRNKRKRQAVVAEAILPYEKPRLQAVTLANQGAEPVKVRSELRDRAPAGLRARADRPWRGEGEDAEGRASIGWYRGP